MSCIAFGKCRSIIRLGRNKGLLCDRVECKFHHNIADFLDLPEYFRSIVDGHRLTFTADFYLILVDKYKQLSSPETATKEVFVDVMWYTINLFPTMRSLPRQVMFIYFCNLLDTPGANSLISSDKFKKFKNTYDQKLNEFSHDPYPIFVEYLKRNFQSGEKFFSIEKNLEHARQIKLREEQARVIRAAVLKDRYRLCFLFLCVLSHVVYFK